MYGSACFFTGSACMYAKCTSADTVMLGNVPDEYSAQTSTICINAQARKQEAGARSHLTHKETQELYKELLLALLKLSCHKHDLHNSMCLLSFSTPALWKLYSVAVSWRLSQVEDHTGNDLFLRPTARWWFMPESELPRSGQSLTAHPRFCFGGLQSMPQSDLPCCVFALKLTTISRSGAR